MIVATSLIRIPVKKYFMKPLTRNFVKQLLSNLETMRTL